MWITREQQKNSGGEKNVDTDFKPPFYTIPTSQRRTSPTYSTGSICEKVAQTLVITDFSTNPHH